MAMEETAKTPKFHLVYIISVVCTLLFGSVFLFSAFVRAEDENPKFKVDAGVAVEDEKDDLEKTEDNKDDKAEQASENGNEATESEENSSVENNETSLVDGRTTNVEDGVDKPEQRVENTEQAPEFVEKTQQNSKQGPVIISDNKEVESSTDNASSGNESTKEQGLVVINEIAWMGTVVSANDEWIELKNMENKDIALDGWKLEAKDGTPDISLSGKISAKGLYLLERTDDSTVEGVDADQVYRGSLGNGGEQLKLINSEGETVDEVECEEGWFAGKNDTKQTMALDEAGDWKDSIGPGGTPGAENDEDEAPDNQENDYDFDIVINELLPNPKGDDADGEWIEIFNSEDEDIFLGGWSIRDASGKTFSIPDETICSKCFRIFDYAETKISLNNTSETIQLIDPLAIIASETSYGVVPAEDISWSKTIDGSYSWTSLPTPGGENKFPEPKTYPKDIFFSEILSNPQGADKDSEWIELKSEHSESINLNGWAIRRQKTEEAKECKKKDYILSNCSVKPLAFFKITNHCLGNSSFVIRNTDERLLLVDPNGDAVDVVAIIGSAKSGLSYNKDANGKWRWSRFLTPGAKNKLNNPPKIMIKKPKHVYRDIYAEFDASKTSDGDRDKLKFRWDFGDGHKSYLEETRHKYDKKGRYQITLTVDDGSEEVEKSFKVEVESYPERDVRIVGLVPNPAGKDSGNEIIMIGNYYKKKLNLADWKLATGRSKSHLVNHPVYGDFIIGAGEWAELANGEICKFSLLNKKGVVALLYPDGTIADIVKYEKEKIADDEAYVLNEESGFWEWIGGEDQNVQADIASSPEVVQGASAKRSVFDFLLITGNETEKICEVLSRIRIENWKSKNSNWLSMLKYSHKLLTEAKNMFIVTSQHDIIF